MDDLLKKVLGIGKKIKNTVLTTSPMEFAQDKLSSVVHNTFDNLGERANQAIRPTTSPIPDRGYERIINPLRRAAGETAKRVISDIPSITGSILRQSPPGQFGYIRQQAQGKSTVEQQLGDFYNSLKGIGYVATPGSAAVGGAVNVGIQGLINKSKGERFFEGADKTFAEGFQKSAPLAPLTAINPLLKSVTAGKFTGLPAQYSFLERMGASAARNAAEGAVLGIIEPDVADRLKNVKDQVILGAVMGGLVQGAGDIKDISASKISKALGVAKDEVSAWIKHAGVPVNYIDKNGKSVSEPLWKYVLKDQSGAIDLNAKVEIPGMKKASELISRARGAGRKTAEQIIEEVGAKPRDVNAALREGAINPDEAAALKGNVNDLISRSKKRGFVQSVEGSVVTPEAVRSTVGKEPGATYNPTTNDATMERVKKEVLKKGENFALSIARDETHPDANATALSLMEQYIKKGEDEKLTQLVNEVSPRFTKEGQNIQILSMYGKLTPSGAVRYTQRVIAEANKLLPKNRQLKLTPETTKEVTALAKEIGKYKEGTREYTVAVAKMLDRIAAESPPSLGQKISTIQTMAQLLNPKTLIRNTVGNLGFSALENAKDVVATGVDALISASTGKRTKVLPSLKTQAAGALRGFKLGLEDAIQGVDTSGGIKTQLDLPNRTFREGFLGGAEKALNIGLRATDRAAYTGAFDESLRQQMTAAGVKAPTDEMMKVAHADGLYKTFQDESKLAQIFSGINRVLNKVGTTDGKFGLGDIVLKYPKTPANLLARGIDYSPAGFLKSAYEIYKPLVTGDPFQQRQFVENLSRALTGSSVIGLGYVLGSLGVITGKPEKDVDIRATQRMTGQGGFKFNIDAFKRWFASGFDKGEAKPQNGDTLVSYDWFQPQSFTLSMGVNAAQGSKDAKDYMAAIADGLNAGVQTLAEQPLVTGLTRLAGTANLKGAASAFLESLASTPASFVPSLANQVGQLMDNTSRETYDPNPMVENLINRTKARIPGLRETLPERKDVFGKTSETYQDGSNSFFNVFLNPAFVSKISANPEAKEVLDIFQDSGETQQAPRLVDKKVKVNGEMKALTPEEYQAYQEYVGTRTETAFGELMSTPKWGTMSDEDKAKEMSSVMSDINTAAKVELFGQEYGKSTAKDVKRIVAGNLYAGGKVDVKGATTGNAGLPVDTQKLVDAYELGKYINGTETGMAKFRTAKEKVAEATKIFEGKDTYQDLDEAQKTALVEALGFKSEDMQYESMAKEATDVKVQYIMEEVRQGNLDHNQLLQALQNGRKKSVSGSLFASNAVIDDLYDEQLITKAEQKALKAINYNASGQKTTGTGTGSAKATKEMTAFKKGLQTPPKLSSVDALISEAKNRQQPYVRVPSPTPDTNISYENAKNAVPVSVKNLITKAQKPKSIEKARAIIDRLRGGGSTGNAANTPTQLSRSRYRPSLRT